MLFLKDELKANEYTLNDDGKLVPGITEKNSDLTGLFHK